MKTPTLRRLLLAMLACASVAALPTTAQAATYSLAGDFSYTENRANSVWSFRMDDYANKPPAFLPLLASTNRNAKMLWGTGFAEPPMMWSEETGYWGMANEGGIIYDTKAAAVFLEMDHGPILVDNNVLVGQGVRSNSEGTVFAHNLFVDCAFEMVSDTQRRSQYYRPHTRTTVDRKSGVPQDDKWYSNIFIRRGLEKVKEAPGYASDGNLFLEGAGRSTFGDAHSVVDPLKTDFRREETPLGVTFTFAVGKAPLGLRGPRVDAALVGVLPTVGQTIEDRYGKAISVDTDIHGLNRQDRVPGPLAGLNPELNTITWLLEPVRLDDGKPAP